MDRQLRLELDDAPARRGQLGQLRRRYPRQLATIDLVLPPPAVDRLVGDLEQPSHVLDRPAGAHQLQRAAAELRRVPLRHHDLPIYPPGRPESRKPTPRNRGRTTCGLSWLGVPTARSAP